MYSYATRGLGFLVRCATISRQLGQGRQRSGGSPLFMLNICLVSTGIKLLNAIVSGKTLDSQLKSQLKLFMKGKTSTNHKIDITFEA